MKKYKEEYLQCCACGHIHKERFQYKDDDNPYVGFKCNKCKQYVRHLRCGENQDDIMSETTNGYTIDVIEKSRFFDQNYPENVFGKTLTKRL